MPDITPIATNARGELTPAQERVLHALAHGDKFTAIAQSLSISPRTVEQHVQQMKKLTKHRSLFQLGMWYQRRFPNGESA